MKRIPYGACEIEESKDWLSGHPLGPVHWDVYHNGELMRSDVPAFELPGYLVQNGWLVQW